MKHWLQTHTPLLVSLVALALSPVAARAQYAPYAMFSGGHYSGVGVGVGTSATQSGGYTALGGTFGIYNDFERLGPARLGGDGRAIVENSANSTPYGDKILGGLVGARVDAAGLPAIPVNPYAQLEIGAVGTNGGNSYTRTTSFAYQVQFGGDFTILPHLAARVEYGAGQLSTANGTNHTLQTFGGGLVLRLF